MSLVWRVPRGRGSGQVRRREPHLLPPVVLVQPGPLHLGRRPGRWGSQRPPAAEPTPQALRASFRPPRRQHTARARLHARAYPHHADEGLHPARPASNCRPQPGPYPPPPTPGLCFPLCGLRSSGLWRWGGGGDNGSSRGRGAGPGVRGRPPWPSLMFLTTRLPPPRPSGEGL